HRDYLKNYDKLNITVITYYEVLRGLKDIGSEKIIKKFEEFVDDNNILYLDRASVQNASTIHAKLKKEGTLISDADILIASIAITNQCTLVTNNIKHFERIKELNLENGLDPE
ncbi:MAG: PIN domain-containing protein, partial [Methanosarcinales archaeon]